MSEVSNASKPTSSANSGTAPSRSAESAGRKGPADLFSNLLSLASSTPAPADSDALAQQPDELAPGTSDSDEASQDPASAGNPLTGLLGWIDQAMERRIQLSGTGPNLSPGGPKGLNSAALSAQAAGLPAVAEARTGQALAQGLPRGDGPGVDITGMRAVDAGTTLTLPDELPAGRDPANRAPAMTEAGTAQARQTRPSDTSWVKTSALPTQTSTIQSAMIHRNEVSTDHKRTPRQPSTERSTVALDERFGRQQAVAAPIRDALALPMTASAAGSNLGDGAPQGRSDFAAASPGAASADHLDAPEPFDLQAPEAAHEAEPATVSHWSTQHLRHASLRVGEGSQEAIDIQLSMDGQDLNVDFRTDNAEARATLNQQAGQSLGDLLEKSGIQLGQVSVGSQHPSGQQQPGTTPQSNQGAQTPPGLRGQASGEGMGASGHVPGQLAARHDSSRPLDLFV